MGLACKFSSIVNQSKRQYEKQKPGEFKLEEIIAAEGCEGSLNTLALGDNAAFMKYLLNEKNMAGKIQTVYIDPPFFSKASYDAVLHPGGKELKDIGSIKYFAYDDLWKKGMDAYLKMLAVRLRLIRDLMADTGTVWVHLDWHASHYVRVLMDEIFGPENFVNEIVWTYKSGGSSKHHFSRKHDTILVYGKTKKYYFNPMKEKSYNRGYKPYRFKGVEEFQDEIGWYTMVNMKDVWNIDMVGRTSSERNGYATQKPEALLKRIIQCSSKPGDICADFFCGSGTLASVADQLDRKWICCDNEPLAISCSLQRVAGDYLRLDSKSGLEYFVQKRLKGVKKAKKLGLEIEKEDHGTSKRVYINFKAYRPSIDPKRIDEGCLEKLEEVSDERGLGLISHVTVDLNYDGAVHRPSLFFDYVKEIPEDIVLDLEDHGMISVSVWDIFGNRTFKTFTI